MKKNLLKLLNEAGEQLSVVEPHGDASADCKAHRNASSIIFLLSKYASGQITLAEARRVYLKNKIVITEEDFRGVDP